MSSATHRRRTTTERRDHFAEVTDRVIAALEAGTPPWQKPWDPDVAGGPNMPCNAVSGRRYRGINVITLAMSTLAFGSGDPRWATYKQAAERGWQVKKGEHGTTAYFFKRLEVPDNKAGDADENATKRIPLLRAFTLFHASQIEGVSPFVPPTIAEAPWRAPDAVETIIANSGAVVRIGGDRAFYSPSTDHIQMPPRCAFRSASGWSGVMIHEAGHWTGSKARLNRDLRNSFGSQDYSREELRVEIAQAMVCSEIGVECDFLNTAAYLASWVERLKSDRKEIFRAAADAQRIADYLLAFHPDWANHNRDEDGDGAGHDQSGVVGAAPADDIAEAA
jgi:antirestriction protein ArdC